MGSGFVVIAGGDLNTYLKSSIVIAKDYGDF
jgi:hypothetical protein